MSRITELLNKINMSEAADLASGVKFLAQKLRQHAADTLTAGQICGIVSPNTGAYVGFWQFLSKVQ